MTKMICILISMLLAFMSVYAEDAHIYKYRISFRQDQVAGSEEAKNWVKRLAHTAKVEEVDGNKALQFETTHMINQLVFSGKMEKVKFPLAGIILLSQKGITEEMKNKMDAEQKQLEAEMKNAGK